MWSLADDEAILIACDVPTGATYWAFQCDRSGFESLDATDKVTSLNDRQIHIDDDGKFRIAISHLNPQSRTGAGRCLRSPQTSVMEHGVDRVNIDPRSVGNDACSAGTRMYHSCAIVVKLTSSCTIVWESR